MEEVLSVKYDTLELPGDYITEEETIKLNLGPKKRKRFDQTKVEDL